MSKVAMAAAVGSKGPAFCVCVCVNGFALWPGNATLICYRYLFQNCILQG